MQTHFDPKIPSNMRVDSCLAGIWRIRCSSKEVFPSFKATLHSHPNVELDSFPENGEGMIAVSFENNEMQLFIGTEDEDFLNSRAHVNEWMPSHFLGNISYDAIKTFDKGIEVNIPHLKEQDSIQIQFIITWSSKKNHHSSCWFAVDQDFEYILKDAGVT